MAIRMRSALFELYSSARWEPVPYRVRAWVGDTLAVDTAAAVVFFEPRRMVPTFAVPRDGLLARLAEPAEPPREVDLAALPPFLGPDDFGAHTMAGRPADLQLGDGRRLIGAAFVPDDPQLADLVELEFAAFDRWQVEDQPLVGHPHDPFKRIDVARSSRHVVISLGSRVLADSRAATAVYETHLPLRWYLPADDVAMDLLTPSDTRSTCAYKGLARYLSLPEAPDIAWVYDEPLDDALRLRGLVCFWAERTDLVLDGVPVRRPITPWSPPEEFAAAAADPDEPADIG